MIKAWQLVEVTNSRHIFVSSLRLQQVVNSLDLSTEEEEEMETDEQTEDGEAKPKRPKRAPPPEDEVPWGSLAAFALHKLFNEWQSEGGEGMSMPDKVSW